MDIARHLIRVGYDPDSPDESVLICPLRLQKLLYYCQGWGLALLGRPLFRQQIEAWTNGPVVSDVYAQFKGSRNGITPERAGEPTATLPATEAALVEMVWRQYACYTPVRLIDMTHAEPPWREARGTLPPKEHSSAPLSLTTMRDYFRDLSQKRAERATRAGFPVIDPAAAWRAEEELEKTGGVGTPAADVFGRLLAEVGE
jgi:uncharacterized phage-associated protein